VLVSAFNYAGQKCSACSRVVVLDTIHDQFLRRLSQAALSLKTGDPVDPATRVGPVISADAHEKILHYIEIGRREATLLVPQPAADTHETGPAGPPAEDATAGPETATTDGLPTSPALAAESDAQELVDAAPVDDEDPDAAGAEVAPAGAEVAPAGAEVAPAGAEVAPAGAETETGTHEPESAEAFGGMGGATPVGRPADEPGYFIPPHIFVEVPPDSALAQEEIFGPVLSVIRARNFDQALEMALDVRYGLTGGLYSRNPTHIMRATREFRVGNLYINRPITGAMVGRQPFGGSRMSGVGSKAGGPDYLLQFLEPRVVTENTVRRGFAPDGS
jgi:acyl-CoA reductase-like NAD-dependent aldehyde dehydrogenase